MNHDTKSAQPSSEQLLKVLDLQLAQMREKREKDATSRNAVRMVSILIVLIGAAAALFFLMMMLEDIRPNRQPTPKPASGQAPSGN